MWQSTIKAIIKVIYIVKHFRSYREYNKAIINAIVKDIEEA